MTITPTVIATATARTWHCDRCDVAWRAPAGTATSDCWHCGHPGYIGRPVPAPDALPRHTDIDPTGTPVEERPRWM